MIRSKLHTSTDPGVDVHVHPRTALPARLPALTEFVRASAPTVPLSKHPAWLTILHAALGHEVYAVEAGARGRAAGGPPRGHVSTLPFGPVLASLPYRYAHAV